MVAKFKVEQRHYTSEEFPEFDWSQPRSPDRGFQETLDKDGRKIRLLRRYSFPPRRTNVIIRTNTTLRVRALNVVKLVRWMQRSKCRPIQVCTFQYLRGQNIDLDASVPAAIVPSPPRARSKRSPVETMGENAMEFLKSEAETCNCSSPVVQSACQSGGNNGYQCDNYVPCDRSNPVSSLREINRCKRALECNKIPIGCSRMNQKRWRTPPYYYGMLLTRMRHWFCSFLLVICWHESLQRCIYHSGLGKDFGSIVVNCCPLLGHEKSCQAHGHNFTCMCMFFFLFWYVLVCRSRGLSLRQHGQQQLLV